MMNLLQIQETLLGYESQIEASLPNGSMSANRMMAIVAKQIRDSPKLLECTPESLFSSIIKGALLGLSIGILGQAWLVPIRNGLIMEANLWIGYQGFIQLIYRSGLVQTVCADRVYKNDEYNVIKGTARCIHHIPVEPGAEKGPLIAVYAAAMVNGHPVFETMSVAEVQQIRLSSSSRDSFAWLNHFSKMAMKSAIKQLVKWLPLSPELASAIELDSSFYNGGKPQDNSALLIQNKDRDKSLIKPPVNNPIADGSPLNGTDNGTDVDRPPVNTIADVDRPPVNNTIPPIADRPPVNNTIPPIADRPPLT